MVLKPVYMDNHATTRVDPRVLEEMLPLFGEFYGNPGSVNHVFGWDAAEAVERARRTIADLIGAAGLEQIKVRNLSGGIAALHSAWRI